MKKLTLCCLQWDYHDRIREKDDHSSILGWCLDRDSVPILVVVKDYDVSMEMEFPQWIEGEYKDWKKEEVDRVVSELIDRFPFDMEAEVRQKELMYYHKNNKKSILVALSFNNIVEMNTFKTTFTTYESDYGLLSFRFWESSPSVLTPVRKFLTETDCSFCQWFTAKGKIPKQKLSKQKEYTVSYKTITPIPTTETISWQIFPLILSFDTEAHSHNPRCFPDHYDRKDVNWCTSMVIKRYLQKEYVIVTVLLLDKVLKFNESENHEAPPDVVIYAKNEKDYYKKIADVINSVSPDIITGYNIYGFDFFYWICRMNTYTSAKIPLMGRLKRRPADKPVLHYNRSWGSSASKMVSVIGIEIFGVVIFDLYQYMLREQPGKVSYKLDAIASEILGRGKDPITAKYMFETYNAYLAKKRTLDGERVSKRLELVALYCGMDALLPLWVIDKLRSPDALFTMASICGLNPVEIYSSGTGKRTKSLLYHNMHPRYVMDSYVPTVKKTKGAHVFDVTPGYHPYTLLFDFQSLYPSTAIAYNLCATTLIRLSELYLYKKDDYEVFETERDDGTPTKFAFIRKEVKEGIFPKVMRELLAERAHVRENLIPIAKEEKNPVALNKLNCLQLALKIVANAGYGYLCSDFADFACKEVGEVICHIGRTKITGVAKNLEEIYGGKVVAGDTDSVMFTLKNIAKSLEDLHILADEILELMNGKKAEDGTILKEGWFVAPMFMNLEWKMAILTVKKKNYAFCVYDNKTGQLERDDEGQLKIKFKGLPVVKKENPPWMRNTYIKIVRMIFEFATFEDCLSVLVSAIRAYLNNKIPVLDLTMISSVGQSYSVGSNCPMRVFSERLALKGMPVEPGELLNYVVIHRDSDRKGDKMYLLEEYYSDLDANIDVEFDDKFYLVSAMGKIGSLLSAVFDTNQEISWTRGRKTYQMDRMVDYIYDRLISGKSLTKTKTKIISFYKQKGKKKKEQVTEL